MKKKNNNKLESKPFPLQPHISVDDSLNFKNDVINLGDTLKFKEMRGTFKFLGVVHNSEKEVTWIECRDTKNGHYRSFYVERLKSVVRPRKSRKKKQVVK